MTLAAIDWFRAAADIVGAFACTLVGQWWGHRQGYRQGAKAANATWEAADLESGGVKYAAHNVLAGDPMTVVSVPDRDDERVGL